VRFQIPGIKGYVLLLTPCITTSQIALSTSSDDSKNAVSLYTDSILKICRPDSVFLITSCNFTEQELIDIFSQGESRGGIFSCFRLLSVLLPYSGFSVYHIVPTPSFSFVS
jgi:hypothetical protein